VQLFSCRQTYVEGPGGQRLMDFKGTDYMGRTEEMPGVHSADRLGDENFLIEHAPVDCLWDQWASWSRCSAVCGDGHLSRHRAVARPARHAGLSCLGDWEQRRPCSLAPCTLSTPEPELGEQRAMSIASGVPADEARTHRPEGFGELGLLAHSWGDLPAWYYCWVLALLCCFGCLSALLFRHCRFNFVVRDRKVAAETLEEKTSLLAEQTPREASFSLLQPAPAPLERCPSSMDGESQGKVVTCLRRHELKEVPEGSRQRRWICEAVHSEKGCLSGITGLGNHSVLRYRCEACDFDLCTACYQQQLLQHTQVPRAPDDQDQEEEEAEADAKGGHPNSPTAAIDFML